MTGFASKEGLNSANVICYLHGWMFVGSCFLGRILQEHVAYSLIGKESNSWMRSRFRDGL